MLAEKTLCFTGHRIIAGAHYAAVCDSLEREIEKYISKGYTHFISGGAMGFDLLAATKVVEARLRNDKVKLIMALPCRNQTEKWKNSIDIATYERMLRLADDVVYISEVYDKACMQKRNRYMVERSSAVIAYMTRAGGGTYATYKYAKNKGREIVNVSPETPFHEQLTIG